VIRAVSLGLIGCAAAIFAYAQNADESERTISDLERELFGTEESEPGEDEEEIVESRPRTYQPHETVMLRALDKITGRSTDFEMLVGEPKVYGSLRIDLKQGSSLLSNAAGRTAGKCRLPENYVCNIQTGADYG